MKNVARIGFAGLLALAVLPSHAQSIIDDRMFTESGRLRMHMLPPQVAYDDAERLDSMLAGDAGSAAGLAKSFAFAASSKSSFGAGSTGGLATAAWDERSPQSMLLLSSPPGALHSMISPVSAGGAINAFGPRVSPIPEPSTYALLFAGLAAVGVMARKRSSRS